MTALSRLVDGGARGLAAPTTRLRRQLIMSMLDIAMAAGLVVLVVLIVLRKKNKGG